MQIQIELVSFSFSVGIVGFLNPCGFAMLPAYVAHYLATADSGSPSLIHRSGRALMLGLLVSAGFITVFAAVALLFALIQGFLIRYVFWIGAGMGVLLIALGALMLLGKNPLMIPAFERWAGQVSQIKGTSQRKDAGFYFLYGVSYALASLGCSSPIFLAVVGNAFSDGWLNGAVQFGAYAMGMSLTMMAVSLTTALSKGLIRRILPQIMSAFRWIGGLVVTGVGVYLIWYNLIYSGLLFGFN